MDYTDVVKDGDTYRKNYLEGITDFIERKNKEGFSVREKFMPTSALPDRIEEYRKKYSAMLGLDKLSDDGCPEPSLIYAGEDEDCKFYRVVVYVTPEIPFHGILFKPHGLVKAPLIIAQHGGGGTPELCSDMNGENNYNHMVRRLIKKGLFVFAPQIMVWRKSAVEWDNEPKHDIPYNRQIIDALLKSVGVSITAIEIKGIMNSITYLSSLDFIEKNNIGMTGISYGGYFTLHTMAADTRIKVGYSNALFNAPNIRQFSDWCYDNAVNMFHDAEVAALCAPRKLYVALGKNDAVVDYRKAAPEAERVKKYFEAFGCPQNYIFDLWEGGHTMSPTDEGIDFMLSAFEK